ncbi:hypothetical protein, partial [Escherichia coli]|uniref:hypothetical protein n=1 Tax=Escherichia coli TaxID=562 RepID=UPI00200ED8E6
SAEFYKSLFDSQAKRGEQVRRKTSGKRKRSTAGPSKPKKAKATTPPLPENVVEVEDQCSAQLPTAENPSSDPDILEETLSPAPAAEIPAERTSAQEFEEGRRRKGKNIIEDVWEVGSEECVPEVPPGWFFSHS